MDDKTTAHIFAKNLSMLIAESKKPIKTIADEIGVSVGALSNYQNNRATANIDALRKIAQYFKVSADWLIGLSGARSADIEIQEIHQKTGLWQESIVALMVNNGMNDDEISDFISYLTVNQEISDLIKAIKQKNEFYDVPRTVSIDIGGGHYETDIQALFKMVVSDLFFGIIDGYTAKPGEIMLDYKAGENNG